MLERGRIDAGQAIVLMVGAILPTAILSVPTNVTKHARQDGWICLVLGTLVGLLIARLVVTLNLRFPGRTLLQYMEEILGRAPGKTAGLLYIWWLLHTNAIIIDTFASLPCVALMPDTPFTVFFMLGIVVAGYAVWNGLEVLSRYCQLIAPASIALAGVILALLVKEMRIERILPVLDSGATQIIKGAAVPVSLLGEIVVFSMIIPYLTDPGEAYRIASLSILLSGILMVFATVGTLLVLGPDKTPAWVFSALDVVRVIVFANFLERLESVVIAIWVFTGIMKIGVFYYAAVLGSAQWLGLKDYRPLVAPVGVILFGMALLCNNMVDLLDFIERSYPPYSLIVFEAGIPLVLLAVALLRRKGGASRQ